MARLRSTPLRIKPAAARLVPPSGEAARLALRERSRPNWYSLARWRELRLVALQRDGWQCQQTGALLVGTYPAWNSAAVDHIEPHHWDPDLFWDLGNLQSVTKQWHDSEKQRRERAGRG
ncbi:HNH endonuclease [Jannaschia formosa]|uniref:HNH endonuclease n=1 Tax=Jannaschia formosa TaxID=2259592 RepID=UPI000E1BCB0A|nr:HNH endonuclease [Jannaschia formosa]TFL16421.1 HNH endonuclease [Jannaschia formosa]